MFGFKQRPGREGEFPIKSVLNASTSGQFPAETKLRQKLFVREKAP